jgi:hypothetical protein
MTGQRGKQGIQGVPGRRGATGRGNYIDAKTFQDFCHNQSELVDVLNHRMTQLEENTAVIRTDVAWTKKLLWAILSIVLASFVTFLIKAATG